MVINTHYRFVFVHIPKTAGTSVTRSLEKLQGNEKGWLAKTKHETLAELRERLGRGIPPVEHLSATESLGYLTFGFVRNPWARMASLYRYLAERRPKVEIDTVSGFRDFLVQARAGVDWIQGLHSMRSQLDYFTLPGGRMEMGFLGHFEHLAEDINLISREIGVSIRIGHDNRSSNMDRDYRREYDDDMVEIVASRFHGEISLFGYSFENADPARRCSQAICQPRVDPHA